MEKSKKNNHFKLFSATFLMLLMVLVIGIPMVSAAEWDNVKEYNPNNKTATFKNSFLKIINLGTIATAQLKTPDEVVIYMDSDIMRDVKIGEFEIDSRTDYNDAIKEIRFKNLKRGGGNIEKEYTLKYKDYELQEFPTYAMDCVEDEIGQGFECEYTQNGTELRSVEVWRELESRDIKKGQPITIGIFTDIYINDRYDWYPNLFGEYVEEWAIVSTARLYENCTTCTGYATNVNSDAWKGQYFTIGSVSADEAYTIKGVSWNGDRDGTTNCDLVSIIQGVDGSNLPDGNNLSIGSIDASALSLTPIWINISLSDYVVTPSAEYAVVLYLECGDASNKINLVAKSASGYPNGNYVYSNDGAGSWTAVGTYDFNFKIWGEVSASDSTAPSVTQDQPLNNTNQTNNYQGFNCTATDETGMKNLSLFLDGAKKTTVTNASAAVNLTLNYTATGLSYGQHYWNCKGFDWAENVNQTGNWTFNVSAKAATVSLASPVNNYNSTVSNVNLKCYGTDDTAVLNVSLKVDGVVVNNSYNITASDTNLTGQYSDTYSDGSYNWTCYAYDNLELLGTTSTRTFNVDTSPPVVTITAPLSIYNFARAGVTQQNLTYSISDTNINQCWYQYNNVNVSLNCSATTQNFTVTDQQNMTVYANDTNGLLNHTYISWRYKITLTNESYPYFTTEGAGEDFKINFTTGKSVNLQESRFFYNTTAYLPTVNTNGIYHKENYTLTIPEVSAQNNVSWVWRFKVSYFSGMILYTEYLNVSGDELSVSPLQSINISSTGCPSGYFETYNYTFYDEQNLTQYNVDLDYNFKYGVSGDYDAKTTSGTYDNITKLSVCINSSATWYKLGYGEIYYKIPNREQRNYYNFEGIKMNNTVGRAFNLYDLLTTDAQTIQFEILDVSLSPYEEKYIHLNRWYPSLDTYKTVEVGLTDENGKTPMKAEVTDIDYRLGVYHQNGTLIYLAQPTRFICLTSPCTHTLKIPSTASDDWETYLDLVYQFGYDKTSGIVTFTYSDDSEETSLIQLLVYRLSGTAETLICQDNESYHTGVLTCNISSYSGSFKALAKKAASPLIPIDVLLIDRTSTVLKNTTGLFISALIGITIILVGILSPVLMVIVAVIALIPALIFKVVSLAVVIFIAVMAAITIHFMKKSE